MTPFFVPKLAGALAIGMLVAAAPAQLYAQTLPSIPFSERWQELQPNKPQGQPHQQPAVGVAQALYLVRSTLLRLNDANRSGNYTVLHDLAAPGFREKNSPADLALIFSNMRRRHFDLFAVALAGPQFTAPPHLENNGMLRLTGYFPTRPMQIKFDLLFQNVGNQWRLFGISVNTPPAPPVVAQHHTKSKNKR
jgi:hypothetical protein